MLAPIASIASGSGLSTLTLRAASRGLDGRGMADILRRTSIGGATITLWLSARDARLDVIVRSIGAPARRASTRYTDVDAALEAYRDTVAGYEQVRADAVYRASVLGE